MNADAKPSPFEQRAQSLLRDSVRNLDGATRARLARARATAISSRDAGPRWLRLRYMAPAGAVAAALLMTVLFTASRGANSVNDPAASALYDLELLADAESFELSQESDLEFIEWAASMGEQGKAGT